MTFESILEARSKCKEGNKIVLVYIKFILTLFYLSNNPEILRAQGVLE